MRNYFYSLPKELQELILYKNKSEESVQLIKKSYERYRIKKSELISSLIYDLRERNNCWRFRNPMIDTHEITVYGELISIYPEDIDDISPSDPYTTRILELINRLIIGSEFFGNNPIICIYLWNRFLWALAMGLLRDEYVSNMGYRYFEKNMELYYELRLKTGQYALQYDINLLNLSPSLFILEKFDATDFED